MTKREQKARDRVLDAVSVMVSVIDGMEVWTGAGWVNDATTAHEMFLRSLAAYRRAILADAKK